MRDIDAMDPTTGGSTYDEYNPEPGYDRVGIPLDDVEQPSLRLPVDTVEDAKQAMDYWKKQVDTTEKRLKEVEARKDKLYLLDRYACRGMLVRFGNEYRIAKWKHEQQLERIQS